MKIFKQLLLLMLVLALVPTAVFGWLAISANRDALVTSALELAQERVERLRLAVEQEVRAGAAPVEALAVRDLSALAHGARQATLADALATHEQLAVVTLLDASGAKLRGLQAFASQEVSPTELAEHDAQVRALLEAGLPRPGGSRVSPVYVTPRRREPAVTLLVGGQGGGDVAAVAAELRLGNVQRLIEAQKLGPGIAYVVDVDGRALAHPDRAVAQERRSLAGTGPVGAFLAGLSGLTAMGGARVGAYPGADGAPLIAAFAAVPELRWGVVYEQPEASAYAQVTRARNRALAGLLAAAALAVALAGVAARGVTRPLRQVVDGALSIARGSFGTEVAYGGKNELGDLAHTFNYMSKQLLAYDAENKGLYESLEQGYMETIVALANSIDSKDAYTRGHSQRVADISRAIGEELGLPPRDQKLLTYGGILHDIGKLGIAEKILCKQARLTDEEMVVMRDHPEIGGTIIEPVGFLRAVLPAVRNHHERWDGTGYPDKLAGDQIPLIARIVNAADTWDACTSTRPYQKAMPVEEALKIIEGLRGKQLDPAVADALVRVVRKRQAANQRVSDADEPRARSA